MTNESAIGYMILACKDLGYKDIEITLILMNMNDKMDKYTEYDAQKAFDKYQRGE